MRSHGRFLRRPQLALLVLAIAAVASLEAVVLWTYGEIRSRAQTYAREAQVPLNVANAQREALHAQIDVQRGLDRAADVKELQTRVWLMQNQIDVARASAAAAGRADLVRALDEAARAAVTYEELAMAAGSVTGPDAAGLRRRLDVVGRDVSASIKEIYDRAEYNSTISIAESLDVQRRAGIALLAIGATVLVLGFALALSVRRRLDGALSQLAAFPELHPEPQLKLAADGSVAYANDSTQRLATRLGGGEISTVLPPDFRVAVAQALRTDVAEHREYERGGCLMFWSFFPVGDGVVHCYGHDLTERRALEEQLRQSQKLEAVGHLAGGIAHDFNNLLTVMKGYTALALERATDSELRRDLEQVEDAGNRAAALTQQLLAFSRRQHLHMRPIDINASIVGIEPLVRRLIGADVTVEVDLEPSLGTVLGDRGQLEQVVMNLAINARDAMSEGGSLVVRTENVSLEGPRAAALGDATAGEYVLLSVADTGCGMDEETHANALEPFFTTKEVGKGSGLGLSTVYGIVKQSGGYMNITSKPGAGARVDLYLPTVAAEAEPAPAVRATTTPERGAGETVVVVEDEAVVCALLANVLKNQGYRVLAFGDPHEALSAPEVKGADLLLTDVVMPGMNGRELADQLSAQNPRLKVVLASGYTRDVVIERGITDDGDAFLQKPFRIDELTRTIRDVLDSPGLSRSSRPSPRSDRDAAVVV